MTVKERNKSCVTYDVAVGRRGVLGRRKTRQTLVKHEYS